MELNDYAQINIGSVIRYDDREYLDQHGEMKLDGKKRPTLVIDRRSKDSLLIGIPLYSSAKRPWVDGPRFTIERVYGEVPKIDGKPVSPIEDRTQLNISQAFIIQPAQVADIVAEQIDRTDLTVAQELYRTWLATHPERRNELES